MPKVSIVIPNWNGEEKLKKNLPSVLKVRGVLEIIVSDDGSTDGSIELIEKEFPSIKLVKRKSQGGFATNVNYGVSKSKGDLIFLLNTDAVPEYGCVEKVTPYFKDIKVFSVGFSSGGTWAWGYFKGGFFWHNQAKTTPKKVHETLWVSGGSGVFRKSVWDELGGLDELMDPFYWEDVDIGYRARKRGYTNLWDPNAKVEHYKEPGVISENYTQGYVSRVAQRNQLFFIWKNMTDSGLTRQHVWSLVKMLVIHPKYWLVFLSAFIHLPAVMVKRQMEKKSSCVTDKEIIEKFSADLV